MTPNPKSDTLRDKIVVATCNYLLNHFASKEYLRMFNTCVGLGLSALDSLLLEKQRKEQLEQSKKLFPTFKVCRFDSNPAVEGTEFCANHRPLNIKSKPESKPKPNLKDLRTKEMNIAFNAMVDELLPYQNTKWMLQNDAYTFLTDTCGLTWEEARQVMVDLKEINAIRFNKALSHIQLNTNEGNNKN